VSEPDLLGVVVDAWLELGAGLPAGVLRLVLTDVDGVITRGEGQAAELSVLEALGRWNATARQDPYVPALALCTGRQAPYVELMAQMTGTFLPCIFEHGAGLYYPSAFRYTFDARLGPDYSARLGAVRAALDGELLQTGRAFVQPGKEATMTLYPLGGTSVDELWEVARRLVPADWSAERNVHGVEVRPRGINKGLGAQRLAGALGLDLAAMAGVGDSDPDLSYLRHVGLSAAPKNATPGVQQGVEYVARAAYGEGLLEILTMLERRNRQAHA
jgi:hydroxymethylpyrimidine pyrophosphatase-like HAD family hydrolase